MLAIKNVVSILFLVEGHYDLELIKKELADLYSRESDRAAVSLLLNWFLQLRKHGRIPPQSSEALEHVYESSKEVRQMLEVALQKERRGYFNEGKREGKREAERKSRREIALKMIAKGFEPALIAEVTGLTEAALRKLKLEKPKK